jgi:hypothetical protein
MLQKFFLVTFVFQDVTYNLLLLCSENCKQNLCFLRKQRPLNLNAFSENPVLSVLGLSA